MSPHPGWIGTYRFEFDDAMLAYWRERLATRVSDPAALEAALSEVRAEGEGAEVEIASDGTIASRSRGEEFYRAPLTIEGATARFDKPNGARVVLRFEAGVLVAEEPGKPTMRFHRRS